MAKKGYALCDGYIYKKVPEAVHTYVYCSTVQDFLMFSLSNPEIADVLTQYVSTVTNLLSNPSCRLIDPITIDFNLIECLPYGTCFNIAEKSFNQIEKMQHGVTPRAFVRYHFCEDQVPLPTPFVSGKQSDVKKQLN